MTLYHRRAFIIGAAALVAPAILRFRSGVLRAETFGLASDGKSDALPSLQEMLAAAEKKGGGTVTLPAGHFLLVPGNKAGAIVIPAKVRLEGAGKDKTVLMMAPGAQGHVVSAPYGFAQIANLTVDGNAANRVGKVGHNIRLSVDQNLVENVRSINAVSYGIAVGQKRYARNVTIRNTDVINAGADGIDLKNDLHQTENILIENVLIQGFGRPLADAAGNPQEAHRRENKAAVDLRGKNCQVHGLTIIGIRQNTDGLRFRPGELDSGHGPGAHGGQASNVVVRGIPGARKAKAIAVMARDVRLSNIDVRDAAFGVFVGADGAQIEGGSIANTTVAIHARAIEKVERSESPLQGLSVKSVAFAPESKLDIQNVDSATLDQCKFSDCKAAVTADLDKDVVLKDCVFAVVCR